jgi:RNA polymerase sigma-70 factor (ECF subfamily)
MRMPDVDAVAVAQARAGDADAFQTLVDRHSRSLFRLAYRITGSEHDAEDVVQETFLRAYRRLQDFEERANVGTWLYRIASNCAVDLLRGRPRWMTHAASPDPEGYMPELPDEGPSAERLVMSAEIERTIQDTMSRLSPTERAAFVLRHFEGMSIEEAGTALGLGASATKHSIFRAVRKMRQALAPFSAAPSSES